VYLNGANTSADHRVGLTLSGNARITDNVVNLGSSNVEARGGGVYAPSYADITLSENAAISDNSVFSAYGMGGGLYLTGTSTLTMTGGEISGNSALAGVDWAQGGGVYLSGGSSSMSGGEIKNNTLRFATFGTGSGLFLDGVLTLSGSAKVTPNTAGTGYNNTYPKTDDRNSISYNDSQYALRVGTLSPTPPDGSVGIIDLWQGYGDNPVLLQDDGTPFTTGAPGGRFQLGVNLNNSAYTFEDLTGTFGGDGKIVGE
jgi:hypothetical protein